MKFKLILLSIVFAINVYAQEDSIPDKKLNL